LTVDRTGNSAQLTEQETQLSQMDHSLYENCNSQIKLMALYIE